MRMLVSTAIIAGFLHGFEEAVAIADIDMRRTPALDDDPLLYHGSFPASTGRNIDAQGSLDDFRQSRFVFDCLALGVRQNLVRDIQRRSHAWKHIHRRQIYASPVAEVRWIVISRVPWASPRGLQSAARLTRRLTTSGSPREVTLDPAFARPATALRTSLAP